MKSVPRSMTAVLGAIPGHPGALEARGVDLRLLVTLVATWAAVMGCSAESRPPAENGSAVMSGVSTTENRPPSIQSIQIIPNPVRLDQAVSVKVSAHDPEGQLVTLRHQWFVHGAPIVGQTHSTLMPTMLKRGDRVAVTVVPFDGLSAGPRYRTEAVVGNTPPAVVGLVLSPETVHVGDRIEAHATAEDVDNDPIDYRYRWLRNSHEILDGEQRVLDTETLVRGDVIVVEVVASDPTSKGTPLRSDPVLILNSPPAITSVPPTTIERGRYVYVVTAVDPDDDPLVYALETAPPGMKIDKRTGRIEWPLTAKVTGRHRIRVTAADPLQARAFQEFDVTVTAPPTASRRTWSRLSVNTHLVSPFPALLK